MATLAGQTLGQYQIIERLGRGGMAEVYKGFHPKLERYAAIKVLHGFLAEGQDFLARFQREAKAIAALSHPNIVQVYDFDTQDDFYYMVIEYIDGGTLKEQLIQSNGPLPIAEIARIFKQTAAALDFAHRQGLLHRDIKPANILMEQTGRAVLTDFGIARILSDTQFTATGTLVGTPAYMSPEQGMGLHVSEASDIYALGVVLYEMLTGRVPFEADTPFGIIHKHINEPLPSPRNFQEGIPASLEEILFKALAKKPEERYANPAQMAAALEQAIGKVAHQATIIDTTPPAEKLPQTPLPEMTIASRPTVAMTPEDELADKATVAMTAEAAPALKPHRAAQPVSDSKKPAQPQPAIAKNRRKPTWLPLLWGIAALVVVALAIWGFTALGGRADCDTPEACHILAEGRLGSGDPNGAIAALDTAFGLVPANEHPIHANLWCLRGDILIGEQRHEEAIENFQQCFDWTEGDPGFEDLRIFAQDQINRLNQP